jgi:hydroxymethylpyrimidine kinase/phosphomethylpyrimidine kinase/thiamine-phosphate diphosphorylase
MAISSYLEVITPNFTEVQKILNRPLTSIRDIEEGALEILFLGAKSVLITNAQPNDTLFSHDYWTNGHDSFWLASPKVLNNKVRGKGRILSSAITAFIARGYSVKDAIVIAKMVVARELQNVIKHKDETFFLNTFPEDQAYLPYVSSTPLSQLPKPFESCQLGLYPIVDSSLWLEKLLPLGVKCIQLRIKNIEQSALVEEIKTSIMLAKQYNATLFINDYWELALELGAEGIHLGQEDLQSTDIERIQQSGCYLGISTCGYFDIARAHALNPSYIACGPIYPTKSKVITSKPLGIDELKRMRATLNYPLVAIGGIGLEQLPEILEAGVDGVSVISAITEAKNPIEATQEFLKEIAIT